MAAILSSLRNTVIAGCVLAFLLELMYLNSGGTFDTTFWAFLFRWLHVLSGIMWIGLLYYFNFFILLMIMIHHFKCLFGDLCLVPLGMPPSDRYLMYHIH